MEELKSCPFCGGEAEIVDNGETRSNKYYFVDVSCKNTNCRGYTSCLEFKTKQKAIEAWNRRQNNE